MALRAEGNTTDIKMAELNIQPPSPLVIDPVGNNQAETWKSWISNVEHFFLASGIECTKRKKAILLYCGGEQLRKIHSTLKDELETYKNTKDLLAKYFDDKVNLIYQRHVFRQIKQESNESSKAFITRLKEQSCKCNYDEYSEDQALIDQYVETCNSNRLRKKLLLEKDLTLDKIVNIASTMEAVEIQSAVMDSNEDKESLNAIKFQGAIKQPWQSKYKNEGIRNNSQSTSNPRFGSISNQRFGGTRPKESNYPRNFESNSFKVTCYACGREGHIASSEECPARGATCRVCGRKNHFEAVCRFKGQNKDYRNRIEEKSFEKKVKSIMKEESEEEEYLFRIGDKNQSDVNIQVEGQKLGFLVDSGSGVDVIDKNSYKKLNEELTIKLYPCKTRIYAYGSKEPLKLEGVSYVNMNYKGRKLIARLHIMSDESSGCVLGRSTAIELGLLNLPESINTLKEDTANIKYWKSKYPELFKGLGKMKNFQITLNIDETVPPVSQHLRRIPFHTRKKIEEKIKQLENLDVIEKVENGVSTSWVSPVVAIPKGEDIRMVVDMRSANEAIRRTHYPVPTLDELLEKFNTCTKFSKVDLNHGYHQIELNPESRYITTFSTHLGLYQYKRLPQGANSAMEEYQHAIGDLFKNEHRISNICDDILVGGRDETEHNENLNRCLKILSSNNLTLNEKKCELNKSEVQFFGHILSAEGIKPMKDKVKAIEIFPQPKNRKQLSSFLGLVNYLARFIPNLSTETAPLRDLLRKDKEWRWTELEENTFVRLKKLVSSDVVLAHFNEELETYIICDAGAVGLGAILVQKQKDGSMRPVHYASRSLTPQEKKYSQTEREALGVVWSCEKFHIYIYGKPFVILTDHEPLLILYSKSGKPSPRILRWALRLQSYEFEIKHIPGKKNPADVLSNNPIEANKENYNESQETEKYINTIIAEAAPKAITISEIIENSKTDEEIIKVIDCIRKNEWKRNELQGFKEVRRQLAYKGGILLKDNCIVVPKTLRSKILKVAHESHMGIVKTKAMIREKCWWPNMDREIENLVKNCLPCASMSNTTKEPMKHLDEPRSGVYEKVFIDILGPYPSGDYIFCIIDACSCWPDAYVTKSITSATIVNILLKNFSTHGFPLKIISDNGANLISEEIERFCSEYQIEHSRSSPYWPQGNSKVERFNKTIGRFVKICNAEGRIWQKEIPKFLLTYRNTPHCSTKIAPAVMLMNRRLRDKLPGIVKESEKEREAEENEAKIKEANKKYYDSRNKAKQSNVKKGDWVIVRQKKANKLSTNFNLKPMKVSKVEGSSVELEGDNFSIRRNINDVKVVKEEDNEIFEELEDNSEEEIRDDEGNASNSPMIRPQRERRIPARYGDFILS